MPRKLLNGILLLLSVSITGCHEPSREHGMLMDQVPELSNGVKEVRVVEANSGLGWTYAIDNVQSKRLVSAIRRLQSVETLCKCPPQIRYILFVSLESEKRIQFNVPSDDHWFTGRIVSNSETNVFYVKDQGAGLYDFVHSLRVNQTPSSQSVATHSP